MINTIGAGWETLRTKVENCIGEENMAVAYVFIASLAASIVLSPWNNPYDIGQGIGAGICIYRFHKKIENNEIVPPIIRKIYFIALSIIILVGFFISPLHEVIGVCSSVALGFSLASLSLSWLNR